MPNGSWALILLAAVAVPLTAFGQSGGGTPAPAWWPRTDYVCDNGSRLPVWHEGRQAVVFLDGRLERLPGRRSGSGGRYSDGRHEWSTKGTEGTLAAVGQSEQTRQRCRVAPLVSWRPAPTSQRYQCEDGQTVEVMARLESAAITFRGVTYHMREVPVSGGTLYTDGARAWRGPASARMFAEADGDAVFARGCHPSTVEDTRLVGGTVTYRTRQALPAGAVIDVRLVDVSRVDAPAEALARQVMVTTGEQVPVPFSLTHAPGLLPRGRRYAVQATIAINGRERFRTTTAQPVLGEGFTTAAVAVVVDPVR